MNRRYTRRTINPVSTHSTIFLKMKKATIVALLLVFFGASALKAQVVTVSQYEVRADNAFELRDYNTALSHYTTILNDEPLRADLYWKTAEAAVNPSLCSSRKILRGIG